MNSLLNRQLEERKKLSEDYLKEKDFSSYVFVHERPYRLWAFIKIKDKLDDKSYWELLSDIWIDSENIYQNQQTWKLLLKSKRSNKEFFMDKKERKSFNKLQEEITVYRGHDGKNEKGFSYTLSKEKAKWFAQRFNSQNSQIKELTIKKEDAFALLMRRGEQEIIIIK
jgi:hypothetical protein